MDFPLEGRKNFVKKSAALPNNRFQKESCDLMTSTLVFIGFCMNTDRSLDIERTTQFISK